MNYFSSETIIKLVSCVSGVETPLVFEQVTKKCFTLIVRRRKIPSNKFFIHCLDNFEKKNKFHNETAIYDP